MYKNVPYNPIFPLIRKLTYCGFKIWICLRESAEKEEEIQLHQWKEVIFNRFMTLLHFYDTRDDPKVRKA